MHFCEQKSLFCSRYELLCSNTDEWSKWSLWNSLFTLLCSDSVCLICWFQHLFYQIIWKLISNTDFKLDCILNKCVILNSMVWCLYSAFQVQLSLLSKWNWPDFIQYLASCNIRVILCHFTKRLTFSLIIWLDLE